MKRETVFLKVAIFLIGIFILGLCVFWLPWLVKATAETNSPMLYFIIVMYISAIPFFIALYQGIKILGYIDNGTAFSEVSVKALKTIKYCAIIISVLYIVGLPILYVVADKVDAPGIIVIGMIVVFASFVIAVFSAILQKLLHNIIEIKSENDLTI